MPEAGWGLPRGEWNVDGGIERGKRRKREGEQRHLIITNKGMVINNEIVIDNK